jgi:hypothetical protein
MPGPRDERGVIVLLRPLHCFLLGLEGGEDMIRMLFGDVILDVTALGTALFGRASMYTLFMPSLPVAPLA